VPLRSIAVPDNVHQATRVPKPISTKADTKHALAKPTVPSTADPLIPWDDLDVGIVVKIKGKPNEFRDMKQIEIVKAEVMRSTQQEVRCWNEILVFRREVLDVIWVVGKEEEEKLRRKAERETKLERRGKNANREERKRRNKVERRERNEEGRKRRKEKEKEGEGLGPENKVNYPSLAVRKRIAEKVKGKYDALGI